MTYIKSISIDSFGGMKNRTFSFSEGLNLLLGDNGSGKSTLSAFIRFSLYGFADKADKKQWMPLDGSPASGAMTVVQDGTVYRIERRTGGKHGDGCAVRLSDGTETFVGRVPGEALFGIPYDAFLRSAFIRQEGAAADSDQALALDNLLFSADENVNAAAAIKKLDAARVALWHKNKKGGEIFELEAALDEKKNALSASSAENTELIAAEGALADGEAKCEKGKTEAALLERQLLAYASRQYENRKAGIEALKEKAQQSDAAYVEAEDKGLPNGYKPEMGDLNTLRELTFRLASVGAQIEKTGAKIEEAAREPDENRRFAELLEKAGGETEVTRRIGDLHARIGKKKTGALCGGILLVLAAAAAAAGILLPMTVLLAAGAAVAAIAAVLLILSLVGVKKEKTALSSLLSSLETGSEEELTGRISDARSATRSDVLLLQDALKGQEEEKAEILHRLEEYASLTGTSDGNEAKKTIESFYQTLSSLRGEADRDASAYRTARNMFDSEQPPEPCDEPLPEGFSPEKAKQNLQFYRQQVQILSGRNQTYRVRIAELSAKHSDPALLAEQITELEKKIEEKKARHNALVLAVESLQKASDRLRSTVSPRLGEEAEKYLSVLTGGEFDYLGVDESLELHCRIGSSTVDSSYLSEGTRADAYLSLRLALLHLLCQEKIPPMLLDETFVFLDPTRLGRAMELLRTLAADRQILLFSASGREIPYVGENAIVRMEK